MAEKVEKNFNARQTQKTDTEENWKKAAGFVPKKGELIIYQEEEATTSQIKIGNGKSTVGELDFSGGSGNTGGFQPGSDDLDMGGKEIYNVGRLDLTYIEDGINYGVGLVVEQGNEDAIEDESGAISVLHFYGSTGDEKTRLRHLAPGKNEDDAATYGQLCEQIGNIETALDSIIEIQNSLIGGEQL